jgi:hypothetical protein
MQFLQQKAGCNQLQIAIYLIAAHARIYWVKQQFLLQKWVYKLFLAACWN